MKNNIDWLICKIRVVELRIKLVNKFSSATDRALEWYYPRPGWQLVEKVYMAPAKKLDALLCERNKYHDELSARIIPVSEAESLFNSSNTGYAATELKKLDVIVVSRILCVSKAQLARMLGKEKFCGRTRNRTKWRTAVRRGGKNQWYKK